MTERLRESRDQEIKNSLPERKRIPLREQNRNKLTVPNADPNYAYRIVNDTDDRVERYKRAGWELAPEQIGFGDTGNNQAVGAGSRISVGGGVTGVLMRIRKEWYDEDMADLRKENAESVRSVLRKKNREDGLETFEEDDMNQSSHSRKVTRRKVYG